MWEKYNSGKYYIEEGQRQHGSVVSVNDMPPIIGGSACTLSRDVVLLVGGAKSPASSDSVRDACEPLNILTLKIGEDRAGDELSRSQISSIRLDDVE